MADPTDTAPRTDPSDPPALAAGWRRRRIERRVIRLERRLRRLENRRNWEASFDRWGPAQEDAYHREHEKVQAQYNALCRALGVRNGN